MNTKKNSTKPKKSWKKMQRRARKTLKSTWSSWWLLDEEKAISFVFFIGTSWDMLYIMESQQLARSSLLLMPHVGRSLVYV